MRAKTGSMGFAHQGPNQRDVMTQDVVVQAQTALASSPIQALRDLQVAWDGERLLISGHVDSFYHKQMAQEVVRMIAKGLQVVNGVDVHYRERIDPYDPFLDS